MMQPRGDDDGFAAWRLHGASLLGRPALEAGSPGAEAGQLGHQVASRASCAKPATRPKGNKIGCLGWSGTPPVHSAASTGRSWSAGALHAPSPVLTGSSSSCSAAPADDLGASRRRQVDRAFDFPGLGAPLCVRQSPVVPPLGATVIAGDGSAFPAPFLERLGVPGDERVKEEKHIERPIERLIQELSWQYVQLRDEVVGLRAQNADLALQLGEVRGEPASSAAQAAPVDGQSGKGNECQVTYAASTGKSSGAEQEAQSPVPVSRPQKDMTKRSVSMRSGRLGGVNLHLRDQVARRFARLQATKGNRQGLFPIPHARWIKSKLKVIRHESFDVIFAILILLHAVFLGLQYNFRVSRAILNSENTEQVPLWPGWVIGDIAFSAVFVSELILRIFAYQMRFFTGTPRYWNLFDTFCIIGGVVATTWDAVEASPSFILTVLRVLRLARLIRTLRVSKWSGLHNLKMLCYTVVGSFNAFISAVVLLFVDQYIFGLVFMQGVEQYLSESAGVDEAAREQLIRSFGNLSSTFWTLSAAITGGKDWEEAAMSLEAISDIYRLFFGIYVIFTYLCVLNILNGVFVSVAMESAQTHRDVASDSVRWRTQNNIDQILRWFVDADTDKSNRVSKKELDELLSDPNIRDYLMACNIDIHSADKIFALLDTDGDGEVEPEEFVTNLMSLRGEARSVDLAHLSLLCANMDRKVNKLVKDSAKISGAEITESLALDLSEGRANESSSKEAV